MPELKQYIVYNLPNNKKLTVEDPIYIPEIGDHVTLSTLDAEPSVSRRVIDITRRIAKTERVHKVAINVIFS